MKASIGLALCAAVAAQVAQASTPQESLNKVYEAPGTAAEIAKRAQVCMAKHLRNEAVQLAQAVPGGGARPAGKADGGSILSVADTEGGVLVATHRVPFSAWGSASIAQAVLTVSTKDGRFKMETTDIKGAQLNTGAIPNAGFVEYRESSGGFKNAVKSLEKAQQTVVTCIQDAGADNW